MKERSLNPAHYRSRMPTVEGIAEAAAEGDRRYDDLIQRQLDDDAERQRRQREAAELAQYGVGSCIGG